MKINYFSNLKFFSMGIGDWGLGIGGWGIGGVGGPPPPPTPTPNPKTQHPKF